MRVTADIKLIIALLGLLLTVHYASSETLTVRDFETTQLPTIKTVVNDQVTIRE